jgi:hypothetical protein
VTNEYVPIAERQRRLSIRRVGIASIVLTYGLAVYFFFSDVKFIVENRLLFICMVSLFVPVIERMLPRDPEINWTIILSLISLAISVFGGYLYGPSFISVLVKYLSFILAIFLAGFVALKSFDVFGFRRVIIFSLAVIFIYAIGYGVLYLPNPFKSICAGIACAIAFSLVGTVDVLPKSTKEDSDFSYDELNQFSIPIMHIEHKIKELISDLDRYEYSEHFDKDRLFLLADSVCDHCAHLSFFEGIDPDVSTFIVKKCRELTECNTKDFASMRKVALDIYFSLKTARIKRPQNK